MIIQENLDNGSIYLHSYAIEPPYVDEALTFRAELYHSDCIFILEYCLN